MVNIVCSPRIQGETFQEAGVTFSREVPITAFDIANVSVHSAVLTFWVESWEIILFELN